MSIRKSFVIMLALVFTFVSIAGYAITENAYAASAKMNKSSVTLYLDGNSASAASLKVLNASGKATWSTTLSKVVTVKKTGNRSAKVTAVNPGKVTVTAKIGKKKYKCTVTVMRSNDDYGNLLSKASSAVVGYKYKTLMSLANKNEFISWFDKLGSDFRRKIMGREVPEKYWKASDKFYEATVGTLYATTAEGASKEYFITSGVGLQPTPINGNYRVVSEKDYADNYSESKYEELKGIYQNALSLTIQEAKVIKCSYKYYDDYGTYKKTKSESKTFTIVKIDDKWYFAPYSVKKLSGWQETYDNMTDADTLYITADKTEIDLSKGSTVTLTVNKGEYTDPFVVRCDYSGANSSFYGGGDVFCEWSEWYDDNKVDLYIYPTADETYGAVAILNSANDEVLLVHFYC